MSRLNWESKPLRELCSAIGDGIHATPNYVDKSGYYFINGNNLKNGFITFTENTKQISREEYEKYYLDLDDNTLLMSINGTLGSLALFRGEQVALGKSAAYINCKSIDRNFCYYYLQLDYSQKKMWNDATGSTIKNLSLESLKNFSISFPKLEEEQQKIAAVLSALDAKIELNQRINTELEAMAKTLYGYWFVQFDFPNEKGEPYKSSGGKMVWNDGLKREIPLGWEVRSLGKELKTNLGGTPSTKNEEYWSNATIPWLNSGDITNFPVINSSSFITEKGLINSATTILPKGSVVISIVRYIRPSILAIEACANQSVVGIAESEELKNTFIYPFIVNEVPRLMKLRTGAQQPHINKETIDETLLCVPPQSVLGKYYKIGEPIYNKIINCAFESQTLTELRDWLLPMLMNGQVKVN